MNIAINAQLLNTENSYRGAGVSNYAQQLLRALGNLKTSGETGNSFSAFVNDPTFACGGIDLIHSSSRLANPLWRILWEQTIFPSQLRHIRADLHHGLVNVLPLATRIPGVVTVHDLSFIRMPEKFHTAKRAYLTALCRASVVRAQKVIAVSQQTADDLVSFFGMSAQKVEVVYNGVAADFQPADEANAKKFRMEKGLPARYFFYVGTLEPRKNLELLIRSFARWRKGASAEEREIKLVLAGGKGWFYQRIFELVQTLGLQDDIIFAGFVPHHELPDWYRAALAFVYPSLFEGFGLPVLEAMACGTPVVCSDAQSLLEVAGEAALVFSATSEEQLTDALHQIVANASARSKLSQQGLERAARFSWTRCAKETLEIYDTSS